MLNYLNWYGIINMNIDIIYAIRAYIYTVEKQSILDAILYY
jgi:hypothetical protein